MSAVATTPATSQPLHRAIPLANIQASKSNPRKTFDQAKLADLAANIKSHGVLQPILVRPLPGVPAEEGKHEIVAGERRFRAAAIAQLQEVPCIVRQLTDEAALEIQVIENVQRDDLHPLEEAQGYSDLVKRFKHNQEDIAAKIGKSASYIAQRMSLLRLAEPAQQLFLEDKINLSIALMLARIPVDKLQVEAAKQITAHGGSTVGQARDLIVRNYMLDLKAAAFDAKDKTLVTSAGACGDCPKRTGNQTALFADISKGDLCTDPTCFRSKCEAHGRHLIETGKKNGQEIIDGKAAKEAMPYQHGGVSGKYQELDDKVYDDPKHRTAREILGKDTKPALLIDPYQKGHVVEVVTKVAIAKALKDQGATNKVSSSRAPSDGDKKRALNAKVESAVRRCIFDAIRAQLGEHIHLDDWRLIAAHYWDLCGYGQVKLLAELWTPLPADKQEKRTDTDRFESIKKRIPKMEAGELSHFMLDLFMSELLDVGPYSAIKGDEGPLFEIAKRCTVDVAKIRGEVKVALVPAKKPAGKKGAAKRTSSES